MEVEETGDMVTDVGTDVIATCSSGGTSSQTGIPSSTHTTTTLAITDSTNRRARTGGYARHNN